MLLPSSHPPWTMTLLRPLVINAISADWSQALSHHCHQQLYKASYKAVWFLAFLVSTSPNLNETGNTGCEGWVRWNLNTTTHLCNKHSLSNYYESNTVLCAKHSKIKKPWPLMFSVSSLINISHNPHQHLEVTPCNTAQWFSDFPMGHIAFFKMTLRRALILHILPTIWHWHSCYGEFGSVFPPLESGWICDFRESVAIWLSKLGCKRQWIFFYAKTHTHLKT